MNPFPDRISANILRSGRWGTVSKALLMSKNTIAVEASLPMSRAWVQSCGIDSNAVVVSFPAWRIAGLRWVSISSVVRNNPVNVLLKNFAKN